MLHETLTFLRALYDGVEEGYLTFTAIHPDKRHAVPSRHVPIGDETMLAETLDRLQAANRRGWGAYFGVATRNNDLGRWRRGGKTDLAALPALFVDLDGDPDAALRRLEGCSPTPTFIVQSGGGWHGYWAIEPATDWAQAELVLKGLAQRLGGDGAITAAHSMRLPGSTNTKPGRDHALCRVVQTNEAARYTFDDFSAFLPASECPANIPPRRGTGRLNARLLRAVADCLCREFRGRPKGNGYIAALCPCGHRHDYPGSHFCYDPARGVAMCFGAHGRLLLRDLCPLLGIDPAWYGGIFR